MKYLICKVNEIKRCYFFF